MKLEIKNINKSFDKKQILHDVSFTVENGRAMGFLGRNGAGKTTTIRILMNVFEADSGEVLLDGEKIDRNKYKIGYLPEERGMYQKIKILDQLIYFGELKGMSASDAKKSALAGLERLELSDYANKKMETLSKGNQQKIQILQAVINDPDIVIFDEPFSGLDPVNALVLKDIILEYIEKKRIVLFSSHQMNLVEEFCDDVTFIKQGKIIISDDLENLKKSHSKNRFVLKSSENVLDKLKQIPTVKEVSVKSDNYLLQTEGVKNNDILQFILNLGIDVSEFKTYRPSLEELFIEFDKEF